MLSKIAPHNGYFQAVSMVVLCAEKWGVSSPKVPRDQAWKSYVMYVETPNGKNGECWKARSSLVCVDGGRFFWRAGVRRHPPGRRYKIFYRRRSVLWVFS